MLALLGRALEDGRELELWELDLGETESPPNRPGPSPEGWAAAANQGSAPGAHQPGEESSGWGQQAVGPQDLREHA